MTIEKADSLIINCPDWYKRADFQAFINGETVSKESRPLATWHKPGTKVNGDSDLFMYYDHGELSEMGYLPDDIEQAILDACDDARMEYGVVWLKNQE